ncbi:MAG TPA: hypothetical protein VGZ02_11385 [Candidatus Baltobacteraceae bacterium]|nr:hypothetical protein [Candidatus Baltobacteraceae bacterium]
MQVTQAVRLPAVPERNLPEKIAVSVSARAQRAGLFSTVVDVAVENHSPSPLICDIRGRTARREIEMQPGYVWIDPNTTGTLHVRVGTRFPSIHTVVVRLRDNVREYVAETAVEAPSAIRAFPFIAALVFLAAAAVLIAGILRPRIDALTMPSRVMTHDGVDVGYSANGVGEIRYEIQRDGVAIGDGTLPHGSGTLRFVTDRAPAQYRVVLTIAGALGKVSAQRSLTAVAPPAPPVVAQIRSLDAQPAVATSGTPIAVRYNASAQSGTVRLVDSRGTPWDAAAYNPKGVTIIAAPHVDAPRHFTIRLDVRKADSLAAAAIGVEVLPQPTPSASPRARVSAAAPFTPPPSAVGNVSTNPAYIVSGTYFSVTLRGAAAHVTGRATLETAAGTPLQSSPVAPGSDAKFIAPSVKRPATFYVMVSATRDRSGQLIVVPVVVHPS